MYDIEFSIPITFKDEIYRSRFENFKRYGLINVKDKKVLLKLLVGPNEDHKEDLNGWSKNIDVEIFKVNSHDPGCKIYTYYSSITEDQILKSRWFAKFDEDSVNDVSGLVDNLDLEFDHKRDYYIITEHRREEQELEKNLLTALGYHRWFGHDSRPLIHEWEGSIVSQAALSRIVKTPNATRLMQLRSEVPHYWGDLCLAFAARIAKIYPSEAEFLSVQPAIGSFSLFGGRFNHVHFIYKDNRDIANIVRRKLNGMDDEAKHLVNKKYILYRTVIEQGGRHNRGSLSIVLLPDGLVAGSHVERFWNYQNNMLRFYNHEGMCCAELKFKEDQIVSHYNMEWNTELVLVPVNA